MGLAKKSSRALLGAAIALAAAAAAVLFGARLWPVAKMAAAALTLAFFLKPMIGFFEKHLPGPLVIPLGILVPVALGMGLLALFALPAANRLSTLGDGLLHSRRQLALLFEAFKQKTKLARVLGDVRLENLPLLPDASGLVKKLLASAGSIASFFTRLMVVLALTWFFLSDWDALTLRLTLMVPSGIRKKLLSALGSVRRELGGYLRAQMMIVLLVSAMATTAFLILRVPAPFAMGLIYGLLNAIPYFGPFIGMLMPVMSALGDGLYKALYALLALIAIQQVDNYVLSPRIMGQAFGASPATVLLCITAGGALGGVLGMFLALPALVSVKAAFRAFAAPA